MKKIIGKTGLLLTLLIVTSFAQAEISDLDNEMLVMQQACPLRWEQLNVMMNAEEIEEGSIWADEADFLAWQAYLTLLAQSQNLSSDDVIRMSQDELTVITECMAQRVKVMLMLGGTPLGESGVAFLNDADVIAQQPDNEEEGVVLGTLSTYPADSCLQVKETAPQTESGIYWIRLASLNPLDIYRVFCEMEHAGGGWMVWGYIGKTADGGNLFEQAQEGYDAERRQPIDTDVMNNLFPLNQFADTEMVFTLDSPDIKHAVLTNKYVRYRYAVDSVAFNNGPLPCQGLGEAFEYSKDDINFKAATMDTCTATKWYPKRTNGANLTLLKVDGNGVYWGNAFNGNNSWNQNAWIYIR